MSGLPTLRRRLPHHGVLDIKQMSDALQRFVRDRRIRGDVDIEKVSPHMRSARNLGDAVRPGRADSATIRSFSSRLQCRRSSTEVTAAIVLCLWRQ